MITKEKAIQRLKKEIAKVLQNTFDSVNEAASYYHFSPKSVIDCCKQRKYSNQEIIFRYA